MARLFPGIGSDPQDRSVAASSRHGIRPHRRRRRVRGLRAGAAPRRFRCDRTPPGGRRRRCLAVVTGADRLWPLLLQLPRQLDVPDGAGGDARRPRRLLAARPRARRLEHDQRHGLHARPAPRLRRLARPGQPGVGLGGRAALLPPARNLCRRRQRGPEHAWRRRPTPRLGRRRRVPSALRQFPACLRGVGLDRSPDLNGVASEGVGHYQITTKAGLRMSSVPAAARITAWISCREPISPKQ